MRIISGQFKSRKFTAPKHLPVRPTTDRAKEALFNILDHQYFLDELNVLDLFAGIGSIAFEFASRGTTDISLVDQNKACTDFILHTSAELGIELKVFTQDVMQFMAQTPNRFDIIFADPPYDLSYDAFTTLIQAVFDHDLMESDGIFILEHSKHTYLSSHPKLSQERTYGNTVFSWFEI